MANSKKYNTYVIGFPEDINACPRIIVANSSDFSEEGDISLFNVSKIASGIITGGYNGLIIPRSDSEAFEYRKGNLSWITGEDDEETYELRKDWGFDVIIYLSAGEDILGYTKFTEKNGGGTTNLNIYLEFGSSLDGINQEVVLDTSLSNLSDSIEQNVIEGYLKVGDLKTNLKKTTTRYSPHLSAEDIVFLGDRAIISGKPVKIDLMCGKIINPYTNWSNFISHQIGYYGGDDIVLESWTSDHYNIVSLIKKDHWGHPKVYTVSKEGWRPVAKYNDIQPEILYLSGRYIVCKCSSVTKVYDTLDSRWLQTNGFPISDPLSPQNKIIDLRASVSSFDQIAEYVPEINETFLDLSKDIINLYRIVGPWIIIENESKSSIRSYRICGPTMTLYILKSELPFISFLNDSSLLYYNPEARECYVYCGYGKTYISKRYDLNFDKIKDSDNQVRPGERIPEAINKDNIIGSPLDSYRRRAPIQELPSIVSGFGGLVFYTDEKNRLYYL